MSNYEPRVMLVTGAAGFIGCNFVRYMLSEYQNIKVISYDSLTYAGDLDNLSDAMDHPNHKFIRGDICDSQFVHDVLVQEKIDTIVHLAAETHVDNFIASPDVFIQTNVNGTFNLLEQARRCWLERNNWNYQQCRFHHVSTDEVFGTLGPNDSAFTEQSPYRPNSPYSASKAASDHFVRAYHRTYSLPVTISNCSNNYGAYQHKEKLIPVVMQACFDEKQIPVYGNGLNVRDWLHVEDHCRAISMILHKAFPGKHYNIGGHCELSNLKLIRLICRLFDEQFPGRKPHERLIQFVEDRKGHDFRYAVDSSLIRKECGFEVKNNKLEYTLVNMIKKMESICLK